MQYDYVSFRTLVLARVGNLAQRQLRGFGPGAANFSWKSYFPGMNAAQKSALRREAVGAVFNLSRIRAFGAVNAKGNPHIYRKSLQWNALVGKTPAEVNRLNVANGSVHMSIRKIFILSNGHEIKYIIDFDGPSNIPLIEGKRPPPVGFTVPPVLPGAQPIAQGLKGSLNPLSRLCQL